jgi:hypothetical protein
VRFLVDRDFLRAAFGADFFRALRAEVPRLVEVARLLPLPAARARPFDDWRFFLLVGRFFARLTP